MRATLQPRRGGAAGSSVFTHVGTDEVRGDRPGELLRTYRLLAGLTQEELAERAGISVRALSDIERGRTGRPYPRSVRLLADALKLTDPVRARLMRALGGAAAAPERERPAAVVPRQLPVPVKSFTGRAAELSTLDGVRSGPPGVAIAAIVGPPGVGKTALALHWAYRLAGEYPDGQLYVNLRGYDAAGPPVPPDEAIRGFLNALDVPVDQLPPDPATQQGQYRSLLAGRRILVVLDNAPDSAHALPLLPASPGCLAIVTSRRRLTELAVTAGATVVPLDVLSEREAYELLAGRLGARRVAAEPDAVAQIVERCGRLPLALAIVAGRAATGPAYPLAAVAEQLRDGLDALDGGEAGVDLRTVFSWSYRQLTPPAARALRLLSRHPGPDCTVAAAAALIGATRAVAGRLLRELTGASLLTESVPGRYGWHDLLGGYAAEQARRVEPDAERRAATERVLDYYLRSANAADQLIGTVRDRIALRPGLAGVRPDHPADERAALAWLRAEQVNLLAAAGVAARDGFTAYAWQLPWCLGPLLDRQGAWPDWAAVSASAVAAATAGGDRTGESYAHNQLGLALGRLRRYEEARSHHERALELHRATGNRTGAAAAYINLAWLLDRQGRPAAARERLQNALALYQEIGHPVGQLRALNGIGWCHAVLGDYEWALASGREVLVRARAIDDRHDQALALFTLGYAQHHLSRPGPAVAMYQEALGLIRELRDRPFLAQAHRSLGDAWSALGNRAAAVAEWWEALELFEDLHHPDAGDLRTRLAGGGG